MKGASSTARLIAASIVLQDAEGLARPCLPAITVALSHAMLEGPGVGQRLGRAALRRPLLRRAATWLERWLLPGIQAHYLLRKARIAAWSELAVAEGVRQVLVLGAGMDGLGAELSLRHADVQVVEIDHPSTQAVKQQALARIAADCAVHLQAADLASGAIRQQLERAGLRRELATLVIAEGLLMYLDTRACRQLRDEVSGYFHGPLHGVWSVMERRVDGEPGFHQAHALITHWLRWRGEPFLWGASTEQMRAELAGCEFALRAIDYGDQAPDRAFSGWQPCRGETLYFATRAAAGTLQIAEGGGGD